MPQTPYDPVAGILAKSRVDNSARADAWDAFHDAKDADDLAERLRGISLPDDMKADLWDLKETGQTRPAATEDFIPPQRSQSWPAKLGDLAMNFGRAINPMPAVEALSDLQRGTMGGDMEAAARTTARMKALGQAQVDEFGKVKSNLMQGRPWDAFGHGVAAALPVLGPAAASAGEQIASGDVWGGAGSSLGLLAPFGAAEAGRLGAIPAAGRAAAATGRAVKTGVTKAAPLVGSVAADVALHSVGLGPAVTPVMFAVKLLKKSLEGKAAKAAPAAKAAEAALDLDTVAVPEGWSLPQGAPMEAPPSRIAPGGWSMPEPAPVAPQVGRLVPAQTPTVEAAVSDALTELQQPVPPARITTPPPAQLPAGYSPRTSVPKPKPAKMAAPTPEPTPEPAAQPKRAYFLKSPEQMAIEKAAKAEMQGARIEPSGSLTIDDLPASWRPRAGQDIFPTTGAEGKEIAAAFQAEMKARGMSVGEAITAVSKNRDIPTAIRAQLVRALSKSGGAVKATPKIAKSVEEFETIYHNSPDVLPSGKPDFDAYFGNADFVKTFPNEWGPHTYPVKVPKSKVLDLTKDSPEAREFMGRVAEKAFPKDADFAAELRGGANPNKVDFYEPWTDKSNLSHAFDAIRGKYQAVKFNEEYFVPREALRRLKVGAK